MPPPGANSARNFFRSARFMLSASDVSGCPHDTGAEVAFAGRSNAGKSTALNALTGQRALARTSKTPGRTQLLNFFACGPADQASCRLVDLPGYGFARAPLAQRRRWGALVDGYLRARSSLRALVLLTDSRRPLLPADEQLLDWTAEVGIPVHVALTKADKLSRSAGAKALHEVRARLETRATDAVPMQAFLMSATSGAGVDALARAVAASLESPQAFAEQARIR